MFLFFRTSAIPSNTVAVSSSICFSGSTILLRFVAMLICIFFAALPYSQTMTMDMTRSDTEIFPLFHDVASIVLVTQTYCFVILLEGPCFLLYSGQFFFFLTLSFEFDERFRLQHFQQDESQQTPSYQLYVSLLHLKKHFYFFLVITPL